MRTRIVFTADLHLGITTPRTLEGFAARIRALAPSALVLLGDIGEGPTEFERALDIFGEVAPLQGLILGNHDLWARSGWSSRELLERRLPEIAAERGFDYLEDRVWRLGDTAVVASLAWYHYSAIDPSFLATPSEEIARRKEAYNNDAERIDWPWSDLEVAARCAQSVERRLAEAQADVRVRQIIVATHVPILEAQMVRKPEDPRWGFSNAYFGNLTMGAAALKASKVAEVVSGHTHVSAAGVVPRVGMPDAKARVIGSAYGAPEYVMISVRRER